MMHDTYVYIYKDTNFNKQSPEDVKIKFQRKLGHYHKSLRSYYPFQIMYVYCLTFVMN